MKIGVGSSLGLGASSRGWPKHSRGTASKFWYDPELRTLPGEDFKRRIRLEITKARFACLLISQDFVNSDFIRHLELPWIRERLERDELSIIPILVAPTLWEQEDELSWLTERQMLPGTPTPLIDYAGDEGRWKAVRNEILAAIRSRIREASGQTAAGSRAFSARSSRTRADRRLNATTF